jgi:SAM-dependent methyltransferase
MTSTPSARWFDEWSADQRAEYADRFRRLVAEGKDIDGEARLVDALAPRHARILDAGCGAGRLAAYLAGQGHDVLGIDIDPLLVAAGQEQYPGLPLQQLDLRKVSPELGSFDIVASAGNVMVYLEPGSERSVLEALASVLRPGGRAVFGFATDRAYTHDQLDLDAASVGWTHEARWATWQLDPVTDGADWAVSLYRG